MTNRNVEHEHFEIVRSEHRFIKVEPEHWRWRVWLVDEELDKNSRAANSTEINMVIEWQHFEIPYKPYLESDSAFKA